MWATVWRGSPSGSFGSLTHTWSRLIFTCVNKCSLSLARILNNTRALPVAKMFLKIADTDSMNSEWCRQIFTNDNKKYGLC